MTKSTTLFEIKKPFYQRTEEAYAFITNPVNFQSLHPLIIKVESLSDNRYTFYESTSIGFIRCYFHYEVFTDQNSEMKIMETLIKKRVRIKLKFFRRAENKITYLVERIEVTGPYWILQILIPKLKRAHHQMFINLENKFTG